MNKKLIMMGVTAAAVGVLLIGCSDFLDKQPNGIETIENFFKNSDQALRATTAIYDATGWYQSSEVDEWQFGDICSDDAEKGGENLADFPELQQFKEFRGAVTWNSLYLRWVEYYQGVLRANQVINKVSEMTEIDSELKARLVGEAQFLRGYLYFQLVKTFGAVPLILRELQPSEYCQERAPIAACWAQIEKDFKDAAAVLPEKDAYGSSDMGRATKGAANSFLAKAYIFQSKWADAKATAEIVINSGKYKLEENYADIFTLEKENGDESIFEVQHVTVSTGQWGDQNEGTVTQIYQGSRTSTWFSGWGFNCPSNDFVAEFEAGDPRLKATVITEDDTIWKGTPAEQKADNRMSPNKRHALKYMMEYMGSVPAMSNGPANWRAMRYADVLLFHAEAANEDNDATGALVSLNKVRARVGLPDVTETDKAALRDKIFHERRVELGLEGHRFFDLVRQGRAAELLKGSGYQFQAGKHEYFPIPQRELDACDKLVQNPYYD
jgi:hypothetical protein